MSDVGVVAGACPSCAEPVADGDVFCEACGHQLSDAAAAAPVQEATDEDAPGIVMAKGVAAAAVARATARAAAEPAGEVDEPSPSGTEGVVCPSCGRRGQWLDGYCGTCGAKQPDPRDHTEFDRPGVAAVSDKGIRHAKNEDSYAVAVGDGFVAAVVCDGVSTTVIPEVASQAAADAAAALLASGPEAPDFEGAFGAGRAAALAVEFQPHPSLGPPSCTYLAAMITDTTLRLSSFGDCRGYWIGPDGAVEQLTVDDSWATEQIAAGIEPAEAYADNRAHAITRWIGRDADMSWRPTSVDFEPPGPGRVLLVSDGVWNYAAESEQLAAVVAEAPPSPLDLARHLVDFANQQGGADNITAVVVDLPLQPGTGAGLRGPNAVTRPTEAP